MNLLSDLKDSINKKNKTLVNKAVLQLITHLDQHFDEYSYIDSVLLYDIVNSCKKALAHPDDYDLSELHD